MPNKSTYKNIIFDLGAVLVNWNPKEIVSSIFKDQKQINTILNDITINKNWEELDRGTINQKEYIEKLPSNYNKSDYLYFFKELHKYLYPLKEGLTILNKVKKNGYKTYALSNFAKELFEQLSPTYTFLNKFDGIILSYKYKTIKPEPKIYEILLNKYEIKPNESLFIDDKKENLDTALKFGIDGILCKNHEYVENQLKEINVI